MRVSRSRLGPLQGGNLARPRDVRNDYLYRPGWHEHRHTEEGAAYQSEAARCRVHKIYHPYDGLCRQASVP